MSQQGETFFTSIGCMDGRVHPAILSYGQNKFKAKYADTITEAGLVGQITKQDIDQNLIESVKNKLLISLTKHQSKGIIVHGHQECAGNPVADEQHKQQVKETAKLIRTMVGAMTIEVAPVFVLRNGKNWKVKEL